MSRTRALTAFGASAALVLLAGCSNPIDNLMEEGVEEGIERIIEEGAGEDAEVDINLDGEASLPSSWPDGLPEPPGEVSSSFAESGAGTVTFTADSADQVRDYAQQIQDAGWTVESEAQAGLEFVQFDDGTTQITLGWVADEEAAAGTLTYTESDGEITPVG